MILKSLRDFRGRWYINNEGRSGRSWTKNLFKLHCNKHCKVLVTFTYKNKAFCSFCGTRVALLKLSVPNTDCVVWRCFCLIFRTKILFYIPTGSHLENSTNMHKAVFSPVLYFHNECLLATKSTSMAQCLLKIKLGVMVYPVMWALLLCPSW